jgi:DNA-binding NarL/FixJ family response regulator
MPNLNNLRILIADDHEVVRRGLTSLLSSTRGWVVCAEATTGREAVALAAQHRPDIVIMDIRMPELNGLEATRKIRKMLPQTQVLVLSLHYSDQLVREIVDAGARAYVLKSDASAELLTAVEALANSRAFFTLGCCQSPDRWLFQTSLETNASATYIPHRERAGGRATPGRGQKQQRSGRRSRDQCQDGGHASFQYYA